MESVGPDGIGASGAYSNENVLTAVTEMATRTAWQKDVTAKGGEYVRTGFPKFVVEHW